MSLESGLLFVGKTFDSYDELQNFIWEYEHLTSQKLWKRSSRKIAAATNIKKHIKEELVYYEISYCCIHGGEKFASHSQSRRKISTLRLENPCPVFISVRVDSSGMKLEIKNFNENHQHQNQIEKTRLPSRKKIIGKVTKDVATVKMKTPRRSTEEKIKKMSQNVMKQDEEEHNSLEKCIHTLKYVHGADVDILRDEKNTIQGIYFLTKNMEVAMDSWPEFVAIDDIYTLSQTGFDVFLITVEDSNGLTKIVGTCLLNSGQKNSFEWFLRVFKNKHSNWVDIQCIISEKKSSKRPVFKKVFPWIPVYNCRFQVLNIFQEEITCEKFSITPEEKDLCLDLLNELVHSKSKTEYNSLYENFINRAPEAIVNYYNTKWHSIKPEWVYAKYGNLLYRINIRLERINAKLKQAIDPDISLSSFIAKFFRFLNDIQREKEIAEFVDHSLTNTDENKYFNFLTSFAFAYIFDELKNVNSVQILDKSRQTYRFLDDEGSEIRTTSSNCDCGRFKSMLLPCRHVFKARTDQNLPLFAEELIHQRWRRSYYINRQKMLAELYKSGEPEESCSRQRDNLSIGEKRKAASSVTHSLVNLLCNCAEDRYLKRLEALETLENIWREGDEAEIRTASAMDAVDENSSRNGTCDEFYTTKSGFT